jgi:hypothetical protein
MAVLTRVLSWAVAMAAPTVLWPLLAQYDPALQFQNRGDRYEGIRTIPVGGLDVELLSVRVNDTQPDTPSWGEHVGVRFYLPDPDDVHITVRQLRSRSTYYWLDRVQGTWTPRSVNEYVWPTAPVLQRLQGVRFDDLGVTVRIGREDPLARTQRVLPVVFFRQRPGELAATYRFAFKTNGRARVSAAVYADQEELHRRPDTWEEAGSPFTILWNATGARERWYRLVLTGYFENNAPLDKEVVFYHRPALFEARPGG